MKQNTTQKGTLLVSLDFELFWGMTDCSTPQEYAPNVLGGRNAIPKLLRLFEKHRIHASWATVGFQFAANKKELLDFAPTLRPTYENTALDPYAYMEQTDVDGNVALYFAPDLIREIKDCPGQEIASHTFSHYYCREKGQSPEQFRADMLAAKSIAQTKGYALTSVVLPRNQCTEECVAVLRETGFTCYRDEENDWIHKKIRNRSLMRLLRLMDVYLPLTGFGGYTPKIENGICNVIGSRMYKPIVRPLWFLEGLKICRIKSQMKHAAKNGLCFHLWWHPHNIGVNTEQHLKQLESIFGYYDTLKEKYGMRSLNMAEAAAETGR